MPALEAVYREAYATLRERAGLRNRAVDFRVRFVPYAGLSSALYRRDGHYDVRLSDLLKEAPLGVQMSLALILVGRLDRRLRLSPADEEPYRRWSRAPEIDERVAALRRERGAKRIRDPEGRFHDLKRLFRRLNAEYFSAMLPEVAVGWAPTEGTSRFGHHDSDLNAIVLSSRLDAPDVPEELAAYVLFHEMLHVKHGIRRGDGGRRVVHSREFRSDEAKFPNHRDLDRALDGLARRGRRGRTRRRWLQILK